MEKLEYRMGVLQNGFEPVPCSLKGCYMDGWTKQEISQAVIEGWEKEVISSGEKTPGKRHPSTGLRCGDITGVDIDVTNKKVVAKIGRWLFDNWGRGLVRIGRAPKTLIMYGQPHPHRKTRDVYVDQDGNKQVLELLGVGQMFVADGIHPGTKKPYEWKGNSPLDVDIMGLPDTGDLDDLREFFRETCEAEGWVPEGKARAAGVGRIGSVEDALMNYQAPIGIGDEELERILGELDPGCGYDEWIEIGMAVFKETGGSVEGFLAFDEWSSQGGNYQGSDDVIKFWDGWKGKTIIINGRKLYKEAGEEMPAVVEGESSPTNSMPAIIEATRAIRASDDYDDLRGTVAKLAGISDSWILTPHIMEMAEKFTGAKPEKKEVKKWLVKKSNGKAPKWARLWVYLRHDNVFFNIKTKAKLKERAFNLAYLNKAGGGNASELLLGGDLIPSYHMALYLPGAGEEFFFEGHDCVNLFTPWDVCDESEVNKEAIELVLQHAKARFPHSWRILIDFLAFCVQNPGKKLTWTLLLQGVEGDGKTFWGHMMSAMLGSTNTKEVDPEEIKSSFSDWGTGGCFSMIEEIRLSGSSKYEIMDKMKRFLTNPRVNIHPKGYKAYWAPNVTNYLLLTNHKDALPITHDSRRYAILFSTLQCKDDLGTKEEQKAYFTPLYKAVNDDGGKSLLWWLSNWELSKDFNQYNKPDTLEDTAEMIELSKSELQLHVEDIIEAWDGKPFKTIQLKAALEVSGFSGKVEDKHLSKILQELQYKNRNTTIGDTPKSRWWVKCVSNGVVVAVEE